MGVMFPGVFLFVHIITKKVMGGFSEMSGTILLWTQISNKSNNFGSDLEQLGSLTCMHANNNTVIISM